MPSLFSYPAVLSVLLLVYGASLRASDVLAPGGGAALSVQTVQPDPDSDELLPTVRVSLKTSAHPGGLSLLDGFPTMCDTDARWLDSDTLYLKLPEAYEYRLHVYDGEVLDGVTVRLSVHTHQVLKRSASPMGRWGLVEIEQCENQHWSLYVRKAGAPDYNRATGTGWADPSMLGGLTAEFPLLDLEWTGALSVCVVVGQQPFGVKFRSKAGPITAEWVFDSNYRRPPEPMQVLGNFPKKPKGFRKFFKFFGE